MKRQFLRVLLIVVLTECIALPQASATDGVWTGNVYYASWSTPGNWANGAVASGSGATATFVNSSNLSQANQDIEGLTLGSIRLHGTAVTLLNKSIICKNFLEAFYVSSTKF